MSILIQSSTQKKIGYLTRLIDRLTSSVSDKTGIISSIVDQTNSTVALVAGIVQASTPSSVSWPPDATWARVTIIPTIVGTVTRTGATGLISVQATFSAAPAGPGQSNTTIGSLVLPDSLYTTLAVGITCPPILVMLPSPAALQTRFDLESIGPVADATLKSFSCTAYHKYEFFSGPIPSII